MPEVFGDTSGLLSAFVATEATHAQAADFLRQWHADGTRLITTNYVLTELVALYVSRVRTPRAQQVQTIETLKRSDWVEIVHIDPALDEAAWQRFVSRPDKTWSLVDCSSFVVMERRGITQALTADHHFEQAGFLRLL